MKPIQATDSKPVLAQDTTMRLLGLLHVGVLCACIALHIEAQRKAEKIDDADAKAETLSAIGGSMMSQTKEYFAEVAASLCATQKDVSHQNKVLAITILSSYFALLCYGLFIRSEALNVAESSDAKNQFGADFYCGCIDLMLALDGIFSILIFLRKKPNQQVEPMGYIDSVPQGVIEDGIGADEAAIRATHEHIRRYSERDATDVVDRDSPANSSGTPDIIDPASQRAQSAPTTPTLLMLQTARNANRSPSPLPTLRMWAIPREVLLEDQLPSPEPSPPRPPRRQRQVTPST